jgi:hypothetical protein
MEMGIKFLYALVLLLASTAACMAESEYCEIPLNPELGKITAPSHVHFLSGRDGCPSEVPRCVLKSYLVRGDVRDGEIGGDVSPKGDALLIDQREAAKDTLTCIAMLTLSGRDLLVQDNTQCGGVNVTFTGTYKRQARKPR